LWRTPPCITASRGVSRQAALDGGRLLCVSDDHGHRVLAPATIRFCPLCGAPLAPEPVPPDQREQQVCSRCRFVFYLSPKVVYTARVVGGRLTTCQENDALEWVEPEAVPWDALAFQSTREALREWVAARRRTPGG